MSRFARRLQQGVRGASDSLRPSAPVITSSTTTSSATPTISGTADAGTTIILSINNHVYSSLTDGGGAWSIVVVDALAPGNTYTLTASARNVAGYVSKVVTTQNLTITGSGTVTIWPSNPTPSQVDVSDGQSIELGLKFQSTSATSILGIRFYKGPQSTGLHIGSLWSSTGTLLASVTFTGETTSGWQQMLFASPVAISANTTYVMSYSSPSGYYPFDANYFTSNSVTSGILFAPTDGAINGNGVFNYDVGQFPVSSFGAANYWVDVIASSTVGPDTTPPGAPVITSWSTVNTIKPVITGTAESNSTIVVSINSKSYNGTTSLAGVWTVTVADALVAGQSYALSVTAEDSSGNISTAATQNLTVSSSAGTFTGTKIAIIGDSLTWQAGNGPVDVPAAFTAAGWPAGATWFCGGGGERIADPDSGNNNYTTMQNIAQCRSEIGEPDVWVIALCTNNGGDSAQKVTSDMQLVFDALGSSARLVWVNIGTTYVGSNSVVNSTIATMIASRPHSMLADWYSIVANTADQTNWWTDGTHMTSYGYSIRNNFIAAKSVELLNAG